MIPDTPEVAFFQPPVAPNPRSWRREVARLVGISGNLMVCLALISHVGSDPSLFTFTNSVEVENWMGRVGAILSELLFQVAGVAAFALPVAGTWVAICLGRKAGSVSLKARVGGFVLLMASLSTLAELVGGRAFSQSFAHWGGVFGIAGASVLEFLCGFVGALIFSGVSLLVSIMILFEWFGVNRMARSIGRQVARWAAGAASKLRLVFEWHRKQRESKETAPENYCEPTLPVGVVAGPDKGLVCNSGPSELHEEPSIEANHSAITIGAARPARSGYSAARSHKKRVGDFKLPPLAMLSGKAESRSKPVDKAWYLEKSAILVQKLRDFGVEGEVTHISPGPVITVYEFKPASGVKIKEIANLSDDLTLALSVLSVRIVAPIPGKPVVGIEIPSPHREMVFFKDLVNETPFFKDELKIPVALGRLASGEPIAADLASMPHLLIAGTTGTGKSVFINTLISSLLFRFTPRELKLILVDPKMVELSLYEEIPHLLLPVVVDSKKAALALRWTVDEMERRYSLLHQLGVRHIDGYNARLQEFQKSGAAGDLVYMPYIVVVIDEYADLMAVVPKDVELSIARLAQKARASGIHLVLATQRPSTDVVTGTIKANFPSRISFRVASSVDSKTILDRTGAERLLGNGDLLFHSAGFMTLKRMQGPYVCDGDIERLVTFLKAQGAPEYDEGILQAQESLDDAADGSVNDCDGELYDRALRLVTEKGEASISLIQRHLRIGYNRAATLMEELEKNGVVAQASGTAKRRSVIAQAL